MFTLQELQTHYLAQHMDLDHTAVPRRSLPYTATVGQKLELPREAREGHFYGLKLLPRYSTDNGAQLLALHGGRRIRRYEKDELLHFRDAYTFMPSEELFRRVVEIRQEIADGSGPSALRAKRQICAEENKVWDEWAIGIRDDLQPRKIKTEHFRLRWLDMVEATLKRGMIKHNE
ncbi:hypothetical protein LTR17_023156 [Elasticomyces elasticus]|nr:hypothetical protein LTR17_023156 [Elasticomyces elasticus]